MSGTRVCVSTTAAPRARATTNRRWSASRRTGLKRDCACRPCGLRCRAGHGEDEEKRQKEKLSRFETDGVRSPSATSGKASQAAERPAVFRLLKISCRDTCWFSSTYAAFRVPHAQACAARRTMKTAEKVAMIRSGMYSVRRFSRAFFGNRPARLCFRAGFPRTRVCRMPRGLVFLCVQPVSDVLKRNMHGSASAF